MVVNEKILQALNVEVLDGFELATASAAQIPLVHFSPADVPPAPVDYVLQPEELPEPELSAVVANSLPSANRATAVQMIAATD